MNSIFVHDYYTIKCQMCVDLLYWCECLYMYGWVVEGETEKKKNCKTCIYLKIVFFKIQWINVKIKEI